MLSLKFPFTTIVSDYIIIAISQFDVYQILIEILNHEHYASAVY